MELYRFGGESCLMEVVTAEATVWSVLLEVLKFVVPSVLVIVGWGVVSSGNDKRETRKEKRQFLDRTISALENIRERSLECLQSSDGLVVRKLEASIDPDLKRVEDALSTLNLVEGQSAINASGVRAAITNNGFYRVPGRGALDCDHAALYKINLEVAILIGSLENAYQSTYQK